MHFPIVSDGEHLFMYPLAIWMYSLEIHLFSFPAWFLIGFFVPIELCKCFIYFDHQSLNWNTICQSFLPFCRLFFILLFLFLCRSFKSDIVTFVDFCICCVCFQSHIQKIIAKIMSRSFFPFPVFLKTSQLYDFCQDWLLLWGQERLKKNLHHQEMGTILGSALFKLLSSVENSLPTLWLSLFLSFVLSFFFLQLSFLLKYVLS